MKCSFCGKQSHEVRRVINGPSVFICDECVELCVEILCEEGIFEFTVENAADTKTPG